MPKTLSSALKHIMDENKWTEWKMQIGKTVFLQNHRLNPKKCETVGHECEENVFREDERKQGGFRWRDKLIVFLPPGLNIFYSEVMSLPDPNLPQSDNGDTSPLPLSSLHPQLLFAVPTGETEPERRFVLGEAYKWIKASSFLLILQKIHLQKMLHKSNGAVSHCEAW